MNREAIRKQLVFLTDVPFLLTDEQDSTKIIANVRSRFLFKKEKEKKDWRSLILNVDIRVTSTSKNVLAWLAIRKVARKIYDVDIEILFLT